MAWVQWVFIHVVAVRSVARYVFTSANLAYLDRVTVLGRSLKAHEPDVRFVLLLVEATDRVSLLEGDAGVSIVEGVDEVMSLDDLPGGHWEGLLQGKPVVEACTMPKGAAALALLARSDCEALVYLDPDIEVFSPLTPVWNALELHPAALTPHLLQPGNTFDSVLDNELSSLKHGIYNLGFLGLAGSREGEAVARWWSDRLLHFCKDAPADGLFTDQRWFDLARVFFPDIAVIHHPGCNVASWNLEGRYVESTPAGPTVNGEPLVFWHYSGSGSRALQRMTEKYGVSSDVPLSLVRGYREQLVDVAVPELQELDWSLADRVDGGPLTDFLGRLLQPIVSGVRRRTSVKEAVPRPLVAWVKGKPRLSRIVGLQGRSHVRPREVDMATFLDLLPREGVLAISHIGGGGADLVLEGVLDGRAAHIVSPVPGAGFAVRRPGDSSPRAVVRGVRPEDFAAALASRQPATVIVNHPLGNEQWLPLFIERLDVTTRLVVLLHDLYWLTETPFMQEGLSARTRGQVPGVNAPLSSRSNSASVPDEWLARWSGVLKQADAVYSPSEFLARQYAERVGISPIVGEPPGAFVAPWKHHSSRSLGVAKVAVIGGGISYKGSLDVVDVAEAADRRGIPLEMHVFGEVAPGSGMKPSSRVRLRGPLDRQALVQTLERERFPVAWFPARAPESYSLALNDAICGGAVPVARSVGAFEERMQDLGLGYLYDGEVPPEELAMALGQLCGGAGVGEVLRQPRRCEARRSFEVDDGWTTVCGDAGDRHQELDHTSRVA